MAGSVILPAVTWALSGGGEAAGSVASSAHGLEVLTARLLQPLYVAGGAENDALGWGAPPDPILLLLWATVSALVIGLALLQWRRISNRTRRWNRKRIRRATVYLSPSAGPGAFGLRHPFIVLPRWVRSLPCTDRRLVLAHERTHLEAGDLWLVGVAAVLTALAPWNVPLWWQLRRLRLAVEIDGDARVLRRTGPAALGEPDPRRYAGLLLRIGRRRTPMPFPAAALSPTTSTLERRIRAMTTKPMKHRYAFTAGAALVAAGLFALACEMPTPPEDEARGGDIAPAEAPESATRPAGEARYQHSEESADERARRERGVVRTLREKRGSAMATAEGGATATAADADARARREREIVGILGEKQAGATVPYEYRPEARSGPTSPRLLNPQAVGDALREAYPRLLKDAGVHGTVVLWLMVNERGEVETSRLAESSGHEVLDEVAAKVAHTMEFSPATSDGKAVDVWIRQPIHFDPGQDSAQESSVWEPRAAAGEAEAILWADTITLQGNYVHGR